MASRIRGEMERYSGALDFARFMELALYAPGLGYYSAGLSKFGAAGDFVTAPEISPLFSRCVARCCRSVLADLADGDIMELGAGSGIMAADVLAELAQLEQLPKRYFILELSAELRERQRDTIGKRVPKLIARVQWLDTPPEPGFTGVILANEVIDALPVHRFRWDGDSIWEMKVVCRDAGFDWQPFQLENGRLYDAVEKLIRQLKLEGGYSSEININLGPWITTVAGPLARGMVLFIDYGYPRAEYYHPQRSAGTLLCHYRHRAHGNPFILPGLQDITAHVDFTAVLGAAHELGLDLIGFTNQAQFLFDAGLQEMFAEEDPSSDLHYLDLTRQIKTLTLPGEMGERFKCMALGRGIDATPPGFREHDLRRVL
ncbi:MAG: SAM-dependent methyltransferase [Gammaproteobacteria bacterium]